MKRFQKPRILVVCMIFLCFAICCFSGCNTQPPSINQVEQLYLTYESDFCAVSAFLTSIPADSAYIKNDTGSILVDLTDQQIDDPLVVDSLQHLWKAGCSSIYMNQANNSISFVLWKTEFVGDAEAGILYAINADESERPTTQYLTELQPFPTHHAWYYYVADYEEWRNHRQN